MMKMVGDVLEEKTWAAVHALSDADRWVGIDELGDFLRKMQAEHSTGAGNAAAERYYLHPVQWASGWDDHNIARALRLCVDHGTVLTKRENGYNMFQSIPPEEHLAWTYRNTATALES